MPAQTTTRFNQMPDADRNTLLTDYNASVRAESQYSGLILADSLLAAYMAGNYVQIFSHPETMRADCVKTVSVADQGKIEACIQDNVASLNHGEMIWGSFFGGVFLLCAAVAIHAHRHKEAMKRSYPGIDDAARAFTP